MRTIATPERVVTATLSAACLCLFVGNYFDLKWIEVIGSLLLGLVIVAAILSILALLTYFLLTKMGYMATDKHEPSMCKEDP